MEARNLIWLGKMYRPFASDKVDNGYMWNLEIFKCNYYSRRSTVILAVCFIQQARRKHFGSGAAIGTKKTAGGLGGAESPPVGPGQSPGGGPGGEAPGSSVNLGILKP